jgi:hypothetical protein
MAKKKPAKGGTNKSQAIRDQMAKHPKASANEIAELASKQTGEEVTAALVYNVKANSGAKKKRKKKGAKAATPAQAPASGGMNAALIKEAAALLSHAGDARAARAALDVAAEVGKIFAK